MKLNLRIDDIGGSTKSFEVYSKFRPANFLWLKYYRPFKAWGPYSELSAELWNHILSLLREYDARLSVGITSHYIEKNGSATPFNVKFPDQCAVISSGVKEGLLEVVNHGYSHCIVGDHLPKLFRSNRNSHREFWDYLPSELHERHIKLSQEKLKEIFGIYPAVFAPPGNVYSCKTVSNFEKYGIKICNSSVNIECPVSSFKFIDFSRSVVFHCKDINDHGIVFLKQILEANRHSRFSFIVDL